MTYDPALGQQIRRKLKLEQRRGVLGNIDGQCDVPGKPSMYYVREYQSAGALGIVKEVPLSFPMQPVPGLAVTLGYNNDNQWAIIDIDREGILAAGDNPIIHNPSHPAVYNSVSPSQWLELSGYSLSTAESPSMLVCIRSLIVYRNGAFSQYLPDEDNPTDLTAFIPSSGEHLFACVWLKTDNTIEVTTSTAQSELDPLEFSDIQECATGATVGSIPAWVWQLTGGMTAISASTPNQSVRPIINMIDTAGSGFAPDDATYITQTPSADLTNEQALSVLGTGLMISTTATGVVSTVAAPTGAVVGTTDTQTLTNKTLTAPTIGDFTNANHDHLDVDDGGTLDAAAVASGTLGVARIPNLPASIITSGQLATAQGGTGVNLSAAGGIGQFVKILSAGTITAAAMLLGELPDNPMFTSGRLTLQSGEAVPTGDITGGSAVTLYFTPFLGATKSIYDGSRWQHYSYNELSLTLSGLTTAAPYDIFLYDNAGVLTLEATAWTGSGLRATNITLLNGIYVRSGGAGHNNRLYIGTIQMQATSQCEQSLKRMFVWNAYNRRLFPLKVIDATNSWTTTSTTFESLNTSAANRAEFVRGLSEERIRLTHTMYATGNVGYPGIALNATNTTDADIMSAAITGVIGMSIFNKFVAIGYNFLQLTQRSFSATTLTLYGDNGAPTFFQMGGEGEVWA